jgi:copper(I)-binding protein
MLSRAVALLLTLVVAIAVAACGSSGASPSSGALTVTDAWARPSTGMAMAGAAYLTITNGTGVDDALLKVATPAAANPELHETTAGESGMMAMHPVDRIAVPAGQTVKLEPGGYHIMLINLTGDLKAGDTIQLTLTFEKAGDVTVTAEVRAS